MINKEVKKKKQMLLPDEQGRFIVGEIGLDGRSFKMKDAILDEMSNPLYFTCSHCGKTTKGLDTWKGYSKPHEPWCTHPYAKEWTRCSKS